MDRLAAMRVFVETARYEGFSAAARALGLSTSSVTRQVDALERDLDVRLVTRTTRRVALTEAGRLYLKYAVRLLEDVDAARRAVAALDSRPGGVLRITAAPSFGRSVLPEILEDFAGRYPDIAFELALTDRVLDLIEDDLDLAIRVGRKDNAPDLIAQDLRPMRRLVCAAPGYVARHGAPKVPNDLRRHRCLLFRPRQHSELWSPKIDRWVFGRDGAWDEVPVSGRVASSDADSLVAAARAGLGIVMMPDWLVAADLAAGRLCRLLPDHVVGPPDDHRTLHLAYPMHRRSSQKVKAFCDHLAAWFDGRPAALSPSA